MLHDSEVDANGHARVLLVEDDARIADFLVLRLSPLDVTVAEDREVGAFLACTELFDLVILDLGLPLNTGLEVLRLLHAERPGVPVIALSARDEPEWREAVLTAGAADCLTKPLVFEQLRDRVSAHISARPERNGSVEIHPKSRPIWVLTDRRYLAQRMPLALVDWLDGEGQAVQLEVADRGDAVSRLTPGKPAPHGSPWDGIATNDLVVARSRHPFALALLDEAQARGARVLDTASAVRRVRNKVRGTLALAEAGLPVAETFVAQSPQELRSLPERAFPLVLKPFLGDNAEGIQVVQTAKELDELDWPDRIVLAQPYIDAAGIDLKLYVVDGTVWAVRRGSPLSNGRRSPVPAAVDACLRDLALACGTTFGLRLYGVDVLESNGKRLVVDVNEFPNYTGVDEAPEVIGDLLLSEMLEAGIGSDSGAPS